VLFPNYLLTRWQAYKGTSQPPHGKSFSALIFCLFVPSLGFAQDASTPSKILNGNWVLSSPPTISAQFEPRRLAIGVDGDNIYGEGDLPTQCPDDTIDYYFVEGKMAPDGTSPSTNPRVGAPRNALIVATMEARPPCSTLCGVPVRCAIGSHRRKGPRLASECP
jgi:hypothetical protein